MLPFRYCVQVFWSPPCLPSAGRDASTLPRKMYESVRLEADPVLAVVSTLLFTVVLIGTVVAAVTRKRPIHAT
jgi:ABC-type spermidine/putrescine transport system permease subunit II